MKKLFTFLLVLMLGLACISMVACKDKKPADNGPTPSGDVVGVYKLYSVYSQATGLIIISPESEKDYGLTEDTVYMIVNENGTASITNIIISESYTGTWVLDGTNFTMTVDGDTQTFTFSNDMITIIGEGETMTLKKVS